MARALPKQRRLDTSVTDTPTITKALRLKESLNVGNADLYRSALDVFDWCVREVIAGRRITAVGGRDDAPRELVTPSLQWARDTAEELARKTPKIILDSSAFDRVVELVRNPEPPTEELRNLMTQGVYAAK